MYKYTNIVIVIDDSLPTCRRLIRTHLPHRCGYYWWRFTNPDQLMNYHEYTHCRHYWQISVLSCRLQLFNQSWFWYDIMIQEYMYYSWWGCSTRWVIYCFTGWSFWCTSYLLQILQWQHCPQRTIVLQLLQAVWCSWGGRFTVFVNYKNDAW